MINNLTWLSWELGYIYKMKNKILKRIAFHKDRISTLIEMKEVAFSGLKMGEYMNIDGAISVLYRKIEELEWVLDILDNKKQKIKMETINMVLEGITSFIFNWTTYFWSIPVWFIIWGAFVKWRNCEIVVGDIFPLIMASLMNPVWYVLAIVMTLMFPVFYVVFYISEYHWDKIKNKKIF